MRIMIIRPDGTSEYRGVRCRSGYIDDIHRVVDAILETRFIERVNVFWSFQHEPARYLDSFVDEHGHEKQLPLNRLATMAYQNNVRVHDPARYEPEKMPVIVGTMVLFEERVWI